MSHVAQQHVHNAATKTKAKAKKKKMMKKKKKTFFLTETKIT